MEDVIQTDADYRRYRCNQAVEPKRFKTNAAQKSCPKACGDDDEPDNQNAIVFALGVKELYEIPSFCSLLLAASQMILVFSCQALISQPPRKELSDYARYDTSRKRPIND